MNRTGKMVAAVAVALLAVAGIIAWRSGQAEATKPAAQATPATVAPAQPAPAPTAPRVVGKLTPTQLEQFADLAAERKEHAAIVDRKLHDWQRKDPDARALKANGEAAAKLLKAIATEHSLSAKCFVGSLDQEGAKKCGKQLWGFDETGDIQVAQ